MTPLYIAAYHQSPFGKLMGLTVPEIVEAAVRGDLRRHPRRARRDRRRSIGAACNFSLNEQGLLAGLWPCARLAAKPIEAVENACASGGQAVVSVAQKLRWGSATSVSRSATRRCATPRARSTGTHRQGARLLLPPRRAGREGLVFPHLFAEVMRDYMTPTA